MTDKERARAAQEYWDLNYAEWDPEILGHHHHQQQHQCDQTLPMTPPTIHSMMRHLDDSTTIHVNLKLI